MKNLKNLYNSTIIHVKGVNIGIIGYLTPETSFLAPRNKVEYEDEIIAIKREVALLKSQGVKIIIALGHSGYIKDLQIAKEVEDLDLVIGGHSNTFLLNDSTDEKPEIPQGPYPTWVVQASGRKVPVVQAYAFTKYLGRLHMIFDSEGDIIECDGTPLLLDQVVPRDPDLMQLIEKYRAGVEAISNEIIGRSMVPLNGECRMRECNLGNLITDAVLHYTKREHKDKYPDSYISIIQGGRIRVSISKSVLPPFNVTRGDLMSVIPFSDTLNIVTMNGSILLKALEHSVDSWRTIDTPGQLIQISGIKVIYNLAKPPGSRIVKSQAICSSCRDLSDIEPDNTYKLIMPFFLADGGDGYSMFRGLQNESLPYDDLKATIEYIKAVSPVNPSISGRVILLNEDKVNNIANDIDINSLRNGRSLNSSAAAINFTFVHFIISLVTMLYLQ